MKRQPRKISLFTVLALSACFGFAHAQDASAPHTPSAPVMAFFLKAGEVMKKADAAGLSSAQVRALQEEALGLTLQARDMAQQSGDKLGVAAALDNVGHIYYNMSRFH